MSMSVRLFVSTGLTREPHGRTSPVFVHVASGPD